MIALIQTTGSTWIGWVAKRSAAMKGKDNNEVQGESGLPATNG